MKTIIDMYTTMVPVILGGVLNMVFVKLPLLKVLKKPIDGSKTLKDGKRLFGENKTLKGFLGMIVLTMVANVFWGYLCAAIPAIERHNILYTYHLNTLIYNACVGALLGLVYVVFELPNSFIKRRMNIEPGKRIGGRVGSLFVCIDQVDSLFGCGMVIAIFSPMSLGYYLLFVALGGITHYILNVFLYLVKLKKNV